MMHIEKNEVHVWKSLLDFDDESIAAFFNLLSDDEIQIALRFRFDCHRKQYIASHGLLRSILCEYIRIEPQFLTFRTNQYGKPRLSSNRNISDIRFNISHSHKLCVIAVAKELEIGIDIEFIHRDINFLEIAKSVFSKNDLATYRSMPENVQKIVFFRCWTRKEAYLKAKGKGLSPNLDQLEVCFLHSESDGILSSADSPGKDKYWHLFDITPFPGYTGALSTEGKPDNIKYFNAISIFPRLIKLK